MRISNDLIAASSTPIVLTILAGGDSYRYATLQRVRELSEGRMVRMDGRFDPVSYRLSSDSATPRRGKNGREMTQASQEQFPEARSHGARWAESKRGFRLQKHGLRTLPEIV